MWLSYSFKPFCVTTRSSRFDYLGLKTLQPAGFCCLFPLPFWRRAVCGRAGDVERRLRLIRLGAILRRWVFFERGSAFFQ
ncbi:hypothetical protein L596_021182 [Steinernema carpocapsae]|uniref:Uncharacterized protein n=1 Tax=Steinernema carpocapsae TaxID=34508 RepID=A0A4U5MWR2_STECR|nr:hypothetical protein L596_021182 [Steinernema carpocapsae]